MLYKYAYHLIIAAILFTLFIILPNTNTSSSQNDEQDISSAKPTTIHVIVALCDNKYQGIVKVPPAIGNGQEPANNLYWGAAYGVKTFFSRKNSDWKLMEVQKHVSGIILERLIFKHKNKSVYLMADAYDGRYIKTATEDLLNYASGNAVLNTTINNTNLSFGGASGIICYTGHDGLMDFPLDKSFSKKNEEKRSTIILACYSKRFFADHLKNTGASPLLWSTGLMAPEAYILHNALATKLNNEQDGNVRESAARAYAEYQKCSISAARKLLVTGW